MVFADWAIHGSFDWFWEFPGLGAPAFAALGLACALAPRGGASPGAGSARRPTRVLDPMRTRLAAIRRWPRAVRVTFVTLCGLAALASLTLPWLAQLEVNRALSSWRTNPRAAYGRLANAADLNTLSDGPALIAGTIALRLGDLPRARREFSAALERTPREQYALLELGAIASNQGQAGAARGLLARARALAPRDPFTADVYGQVQAGRRVDIAALNDGILRQAQSLH
jgi:tetratricopeptide (TPR) repeat protein